MSEKSPTFESLMTELDGLIAKLEADDLELDAAIAHSQSALSLIEQCRTRLETARQKIDKLVVQADGSHVEERQSS